MVRTIPKVAISHNNLRSAWEKLGKYQKAIVTIQLLQLGHWGAALEGQDRRVENIVGLFAEKS